MLSYPIHVKALHFLQMGNHRILTEAGLTPQRSIIAKTDSSGRRVRFEMYENVTVIEREDEPKSNNWVRLHAFPNSAIEQADLFEDDYGDEDDAEPMPVPAKSEAKPSLSALGNVKRS